MVGGVSLSQGFLRRVDEINRATRAIMHGDMSDRIRTGGTDDELDQLGRNLNDMLDRLHGLMEGLKQVSNDIAHDLRTPLSRLKQRLEAVRFDARSIRDYEEAVDQALQDANIALSTFGALLRIAQIESGTRRANFGDLDLSSLMVSLGLTYAAVAEDSGKTLKSSIDPGLHIRGDRDLLTQMFVNLIENALRHTPDGARIDISLRMSEPGPLAEVSDDGPGISESERGKVFKRFYRLEASRSTPGSGLGLALVAAVADLHSARVELSDNGPGLKFALQFKG
jgi:signal transduction histidine kinase